MARKQAAAITRALNDEFDGAVATQASLDVVVEKVDALEVKVDKLDRRVDALEVKVDKLDRKVDKLDRKVDGLQGQVEGIKDTLDAMKTMLQWVGVIVALVLTLVAVLTGMGLLNLVTSERDLADIQAPAAMPTAETGHFQAAPETSSAQGTDVPLGSSPAQGRAAGETPPH